MMLPVLTLWARREGGTFKQPAKSKAYVNPGCAVRFCDVTTYGVAKKGSPTKEEVELQTILFEALLPHYRKLGTYLMHIPQEKRFQVLILFLKLFTPEQAKQIGDAIAGKL